MMGIEGAGFAGDEKRHRERKPQKAKIVAHGPAITKRDVDVCEKFGIDPRAKDALEQLCQVLDYAAWKRGSFGVPTVHGKNMPNRTGINGSKDG